MDNNRIRIAIAQLKVVHSNMNDCTNRTALKDAIDEIEASLIKDCTTCKHIIVSKSLLPCYGCRDNDKFDHYEPIHT